jgi:hypothetical protein
MTGCLGFYDLVGKVLVENSGFNQWAETNNVHSSHITPLLSFRCCLCLLVAVLVTTFLAGLQIIIVYPQTTFSVVNPEGCWDWYSSHDCCCMGVAWIFG